MRLADIPASGPVLAQFSYAMRGPRAMPKLGVIEVQSWPVAPTPASGGFEDAVRAARELAARSLRDGMHRLPIPQAHGVLQGGDGAFSIVPLGGVHRGRTGPVFIDGAFFERTAHSLQVVRAATELVAVVGAERVLDLRRTGAAFVQATNVNPPVTPRA